MMFYLTGVVIVGAGFACGTRLCFSTWLTVAHPADFMALTLRSAKTFVQPKQREAFGHCQSQSG